MVTPDKCTKLRKISVSLIFSLVVTLFNYVSPYSEKKVEAETLSKNQTIEENTSINETPFHKENDIKHLTEQDAKSNNKKNIPTGKLAKNEFSANVNNKHYTMAQLNNMNYNELVNVLTSIQWYQIDDLFQYNSDSYHFYNDDNRIQYILDSLKQRGSEYTATDDKGIPTLSEVLRSGFYLAYYNQPLKRLYDRKYREKCIPAIIEIQKNSNFSLGEAEQNGVIKSIGMLIGNSACNSEIVNNTVPILDQFNTDLNGNLKNLSKSNAVYELMKGIEYDLTSYAYNLKIQPNETPWYKNIDKYIDLVSNYGLIGTETKDNSWLIGSGLYFASKLYKFHSNPDKIRGMMGKSLTLYPYLSDPYLKAADYINSYFDGKLTNGESLDINKLKEDGKKKYLPKTYTFDDSTMVIKTGDKVSKDKVEKLYWAAKEVESQFFRVIGNSKPLEKGNKDDVLTMVIYNSPDEYKLNSMLYGYDTNNGGIYIEGQGIFFTYERTPQESIFSLEELFRHEFVHYLQGRYLVPGIWGRSDFYKGKNWRLTWYEEGTAEFFAGSTRENDILPRKTEVQGISRNPEQRYSVNKLLHSKYGSFEFYNYGFAFSDCMYNHYKSIFDYLNQLIMSNNVSAYDTYIESLSNDYYLNVEYKNHMQELVDKYDQLTVPLVSEDYLKNYPKRNPETIKSDVKSIINLSNIETKISKSERFDNFTLKGTYTGGTSKGKTQDWEDMNKKANELLAKLDKMSWKGYSTFTSYFVNYRVNSNNEYQFDLVVTGMLPKGNIQPAAPQAKIEWNKCNDNNQQIAFVGDKSVDTDGSISKYEWNFGDGQVSTEKNPTHTYKDNGTYTITLKVTDDVGLTNETKVTIVVEKDNNIAPVPEIKWIQGSNNQQFNFVGDKSTDSDGKIVKYEWDFGDGTNSEEVNPTHVYKNSGTYLVKLKVTDNKGATTEKTLTLVVEKNVVYDEKESNDTFEEANSIALDNTYLGTFDNEDNKDIFEFEVTEASTININLENINKTGLSWNLYSANDTKNYLSYPTQRTGNELNGKVDITTPGKYYVTVYRYDNKAGKYSLNISNSLIVNKEHEDNNSFDKANKINLNNTVTASLNSKDDKDYFVFDLSEDKDIDITVDKLNSAGLNWKLYKDDDLNHYVTYARRKGDLLENKYKAKAGRYYLLVYNYDGSNASYNIQIK